jgi:hypothetical protein
MTDQLRTDALPHEPCFRAPLLPKRSIHPLTQREIYLMRKFLAGVLGLSLAAMLIYGAIGTGATFNFTGTATQQINVGTLAVDISSTTPGAVVDNTAKTVTCPVLPVMVSSQFSPTGACNVTLTNVGSIAPLNLSVFMQSTTNLPAGDISNFAVMPTGLPGAPAVTPLSTAFTVVGPTVVSPSFPMSMNFAYVWGYGAPAYSDLTNADMGKTVTVTYTFQIAN